MRDDDMLAELNEVLSESDLPGFYDSKEAIAAFDAAIEQIAEKYDVAPCIVEDLWACSH